MARPADQDDRAVLRGLQLRHHRPHRRDQDGRAPRPAGRGREPRRRLDHHRHRLGREVRARRLHARARQHHDACRERGAQRHPAVRSGQGFRAGRDDRRLAVRADRRDAGGGADAEGFRRARQSQARLAELRLGRHRHAGPSRRRAVQEQGRHRGDARALPRQRAVDDRSDAGPHRSLGQHHPADAAAHPRGQASRASPP